MNGNKKKIIYCITKANWGGAQKYVYDMATALDSSLYEVMVLMGGDGYLNTKLKEKGIKTVVLKNLSRDISFLKDFISFCGLVKIFIKERPDIIHLNSSKMGLLGALAGRILFIPKIIFTGHGWAFNEDRSKLQKKIIYLLHKITIFLSHTTIAVSEQTKSQIVKNGNKSKKIVVIRNGIGEIDFLTREVAREKILEKLPADLDTQNRFLIGTISELHKNKGLEYLIEAVRLLKVSGQNISLPIVVIIGDGEKGAELREIIKRYSLEDTIFMVGRIDEASKYLKAFDIFTLTSITEALPYVLLEAGKARLAVIASRVGGIGGIVEDMKSGMLVEPKNSDGISKAIDFLLKNKGKVDIFGKNLQEKIENDFSRDEMVRRTIEVYKV